MPDDVPPRVGVTRTGIRAGEDPNEFVRPVDEVPGGDDSVYFELVRVYGGALLHHASHAFKRVGAVWAKQRHSGSEGHTGSPAPVKPVRPFTLVEDIDPFPGHPDLCGEYGIRPMTYPVEDA